MLRVCRYIIPGGSAGHYERNGYTFDVGSSMMFGFGEHGTTNLITRALATVGRHIPTIPDPTQIHYHLPASPAHPQVRLEVFLGPAERWNMVNFARLCVTDLLMTAVVGTATYFAAECFINGRIDVGTVVPSNCIDGAGRDHL